MEVGHCLHCAQLGWGADGGARRSAGEGERVLAAGLRGLLEGAVYAFDADCVGYGEDVVEVGEDGGAEAGCPAAGIHDYGRDAFLAFSCVCSGGELADAGDVVVGIVFEGCGC